jgi:hypothetical protein
MLQIRLNAFETNSSSVHSFYIKKDFKLEPFKEPITIDAFIGCYDWDVCKYANQSFYLIAGVLL